MRLHMNVRFFFLPLQNTQFHISLISLFFIVIGMEELHKDNVSMDASQDTGGTTLLDKTKIVLQIIDSNEQSDQHLSSQITHSNTQDTNCVSESGLETEIENSIQHPLPESSQEAVSRDSFNGRLTDSNQNSIEGDICRIDSKENVKNADIKSSHIELEDSKSSVEDTSMHSEDSDITKDGVGHCLEIVVSKTPTVISVEEPSVEEPSYDCSTQEYVLDCSNTSNSQNTLDTANSHSLDTSEDYGTFHKIAFHLESLYQSFESNASQLDDMKKTLMVLMENEKDSALYNSLQSKLDEFSIQLQNHDASMQETKSISIENKQALCVYHESIEDLQVQLKDTQKEVNSTHCLLESTHKTVHETLDKVNASVTMLNESYSENKNRDIQLDKTISKMEAAYTKSETSHIKLEELNNEVKESLKLLQNTQTSILSSIEKLNEHIHVIDSKIAAKKLSKRKKTKPLLSWNMATQSLLTSFFFIFLANTVPWIFIPRINDITADPTQSTSVFSSIWNLVRSSPIDSQKPSHNESEHPILHRYVIPVYFQKAFGYADKAIDYLNGHDFNNGQFIFKKADDVQTLDSNCIIYVLEEFHKGRTLNSLKDEIHDIKDRTGKDVFIVVYRYGEYPSALGDLYLELHHIYEVLHIQGNPNTEGKHRTQMYMESLFNDISKTEKAGKLD